MVTGDQRALATQFDAWGQRSGAAEAGAQVPSVPDCTFSVRSLAPPSLYFCCVERRVITDPASQACCESAGRHLRCAVGGRWCEHQPGQSAARKTTTVETSETHPQRVLRNSACPGRAGRAPSGHSQLLLVTQRAPEALDVLSAEKGRGRGTTCPGRSGTESI